ncbi:unnamed protein product [Allacma fusca]|uniref:Uncharacterized protein n=1 Tax=Allacma fusca TaxID=39272 RepID=A0A8J2LBS8_9HEXA|nr:unnamed protein product [Allacma fusca]
MKVKERHVVYRWTKFRIDPPKIDSVEAIIRVLSEDKMTYRVIQDKLLKQGHKISIGSISHVLNSKGKIRQAKVNGLPQSKDNRPPIVRNPGNIRKVARYASNGNPLSQRAIAKKLGTSHTTVNKIIHGDLVMQTRKKHRGHTLKDSHKQNRKTNARELYAHLGGKRSDFALNLEEAYFYIQDCSGERRIFFTKDRNLEVAPVMNKKEKLMIGGAMTGRGALPLFKVPHNLKGNSHCYVREVLKPLLEVEGQKRYGEDTSNVYAHHDATSSHNARFTQDYARELTDRTWVTLISNSEIPVKSPDESPVDVFGLGILKKNPFNRRASTLKGLWEVVNEEWNSTPPEKCLEVIVSWQRRLISISKRNGEHVENTGQVHRRVLCPKN